MKKKSQCPFQATVHKTEFVDSNLTFTKQMTKNSVQNLMTELELYIEYVSHNLVDKTVFVTHNLVHKTEFVDNNLKFAYEMAMEFND